MTMHLVSNTEHAIDLAQIIDEAWAHPEQLYVGMQGPVREAVSEAMARLDDGTLRVAEKVDGAWRVNEWLINALMVASHIGDYSLVDGGPGAACWWDKEHSKFAGWGEAQFRAAAFRALPGCFVRYSAHVARKVVLLPSFVSWGARVDEGTMIDSWATVGSCAQVGRNVHISAGVVLGGVIEPRQVRPVVIEDDCFVGAQCSVVEGMIVGEGSVIGAGTILSASTKIIDRATGEVFRGAVPPYSVVVPGSLPGQPLADGSPGPLLHCAVIVKRVDAKTRAKACVNDLFRA